MTAAKTHRGAAPAKGKPAGAASAKATPAAGPKHPAKRVPARSAPAAKAAAHAPSAKRTAAAPAARAARARPAAAACAPAKTPPTAGKSSVRGSSAHPKGGAGAKPSVAAVAAAPKGSSPKKPAAKSPGRKGRGDSGSEANLHKRVDSERIAQHIAAFEKSGGRVEKLGVTRVLQRVSEQPASAPAQASKTGGRRR